MVIAPKETFVAADPDAVPVIVMPDFAVIKAGNSTDMPVVDVPKIVTEPNVALIVPAAVLWTEKVVPAPLI
jgi:hypothetical protein